MLENIKKKINSWMESLAESNKKEYGNKKLDCCGLNKEVK
jgi:hypothetical protein